MSEQNTEQAIRVGQITDVHANRSSQGELQDGKFSYQLILDNGVKKPRWRPLRTRPAMAHPIAPAGLVSNGEILRRPRARHVCTMVKGYAVRVASGGKDKQEKYLTRSVRVTCESHEGFRERLRPLPRPSEPRFYARS